MQNIGECKEIPTPYTYGESMCIPHEYNYYITSFLLPLPAGADSRPASELLVELRHKQLLEHITNMRLELEGNMKTLLANLLHSHPITAHEVCVYSNH